MQTLAHTLQAMGQDEGMYQQYIPLALHLAEEHFLMHQSKDVQLLIACCIADVLRVYAPEAPYKDADQVAILITIIQLRETIIRSSIYYNLVQSSHGLI